MDKNTSPKKEKKLKGVIPGLQPKVLFFVFSICGLLLLGLRIYQTLGLMDPATGFFTQRNHFTIPVFYVLSIGMTIACFLLFYLGGQLPVSSLKIRRNLPHALACLFFAATLIYDALNELDVYRRLETESFLTDTGAATKKILLAYIIFAAIAAVVMLIDAFLFSFGAALRAKFRIIRLLPVFWAFFLTIRYFSVTASYIHNTQLFLTIFSSAFFMLFLFEYARKVASVVPEENTAVYCASGVVSVVLLLTVGFTNLLLVVTGKGAIPECEFAAYSIAGGLFCITSLLLLKQGSADAETAEIPTSPLASQSDPAPGAEG